MKANMECVEIMLTEEDIDMMNRIWETSEYKYYETDDFYSALIRSKIHELYEKHKTTIEKYGYCELDEKDTMPYEDSVLDMTNK